MYFLSYETKTIVFALNIANQLCLEITIRLMGSLVRGSFRSCYLFIMHQFNDTGNQCEDLLTFKEEIMTPYVSFKQQRCEGKCTIYTKKSSEYVPPFQREPKKTLWESVIFSSSLSPVFRRLLLTNTTSFLCFLPVLPLQES